MEQVRNTLNNCSSVHLYSAFFLPQVFFLHETDSFCRIHPGYKIIDADGNSDRLRSMMFIKQIFRSMWCLTSILIIY